MSGPGSRQFVQNSLQKVQDAVQAARVNDRPLRLVAVSKYKTSEEISYAYEAGQRHFGRFLV